LKDFTPREFPDIVESSPPSLPIDYEEELPENDETPVDPLPEL
jgi:hypothetical protein